MSYRSPPTDAPLLLFSTQVVALDSRSSRDGRAPHALITAVRGLGATLADDEQARAPEPTLSCRVM